MTKVRHTLIKFGILSSHLVMGSRIDSLLAEVTNNKVENFRKPNVLLCVADDASFSYFSSNGCKWVHTPAFDQVANQGILFTNAYTPNAKSAPSRACLLTGRNSWQLEEAGNHVGYWPDHKYLTFFEALALKDYSVGYTGKGWGPGNPGMQHGLPRKLTGEEFNSRKLIPPSKGISIDDYASDFDDFILHKSNSQSWCFWYGAREPHRPYEYGSGVSKGGKRLSEIDKVPHYWPDNDSVRNDMLDYAYEVEYFDHQLGIMLKLLEDKGELDNTLVIVTSDNGMPFPRCKGFQYEQSTHMPLAIMWPRGIKNPGRIINSYISFIDLAPTIMESLGFDMLLSGMELSPGKSFTDIFQDKMQKERNFIILGQERHDPGRPINQGYPIRSIIKDGFLYIYNFKNDLWPAGNPETGYLNTDGSPTKSNILNLRRAKIDNSFWTYCFSKHQSEELYNIDADKECLVNLADKDKFRDLKVKMKQLLFEELIAQNDPRVLGHGDVFDTYPFDDPYYTNFYERFMKGEISKEKMKWVNKCDFEESE